MASQKQMEARDSGTLSAMAKVAVDRSGGELEAFVGKRFVNDDLLKYIGDRAPSVKRLCIISCKDVSNHGFEEAIKKVPLLEEHGLSLCPNIYERYVFETTGKSCPKLTRFRRSQNRIHRHEDSASFKDKEAMGIATMAGLRSLNLFGNTLTNGGLAAILDSCPHLETLDIRHCFNIIINMDYTLRAKCAGLKTLRFPEDRVDDYEFKDQLPIRWLWSREGSDYSIIDLTSDDDDYEYDYAN
ncbi:hypothetical protein BS78_07G075100 [Paspalum vaginatum]|nr:hypothetical protein BS78_07G075100 [Paspalum vaginatum]